MSIFENASRKKFRFDSVQGSLTVEDLWDIPLTWTRSAHKANLDSIAKELNKQLKEEDIESFVIKKVAVDEEISQKFELVKHIIAVRLAETEAADVIKRNKEKKHLLLGIIAQKENEQLMGSSLEELKSMVESL